MVISVKKLIEFFITIIFVLLSYYDTFFVKTLLIWMIAYSVIKITKTKSQILLILQLFMLTYFLYIIPFIFFELPLSIYQVLFDPDMFDNVSGVLRVQSIFLVVFISLLPIKEETPIRRMMQISNANVPYILSLLLMVISFADIPFGETILESMYSIDTASTIYFDYFLIFALINYKFSSSKFQKGLNCALILLMAAMPLLFGKRLASVQLFILFFILFIEGNYKTIYIYILTIAGYVLNSLFAFYRVHSNQSLIGGLFGLNDNDILNNNQTGVWFASEIIYKLIGDGIFDLEFRLKSIVGTFLNSFLPTSLTPNEALVNIYIMENGLAPLPGNGGLVGISGYLWFGYLGTLLFAYILGRLIFKGFQTNKQVYVCWTILLLCTLPKWYTYNIRIVFKFAFVYFTLYYLSTLLAKFSSRPKVINKNKISIRLE
ncbi:hypothetical protein [Dendrosporobacter sp. 1207_IL3150]|uniref:hypothetical protein n=1 Tax=Dendrosporobacter sp. 1207_IL3150 TaxID=3084054 RepID=UPI002FD8A865